MNENEKASHPAPAPIVGERDKKTECTCICGPTDTNPICAWPNCFKPEENTGDSVAPTEQALPEEVDENLKSLITNGEKAFREGSSSPVGNFILGIIFSYRHMQPQLDMLHGKPFSLRNHGAMESKIEKLQFELTSARQLILDIKIGSIYQEPADECDKWLNDNPEGKP